MALLLGAITGNASDTELHILSRFADSFGIAYQIRDDLNEFNGRDKFTTTDDFSFLLALINDYCKEFKTPHPLSSNGHNTIPLLVGFINDKGLAEKAGNLLKPEIEQCYRLLDELSNQQLRLSLYGVVGKVFTDYAS